MTEGLRKYPFACNVDRCAGNCHALNDLSNIACVLNKKEDLNLNAFNLITEINESKILTKHVP